MTIKYFRKAFSVALSSVISLFTVSAIVINIKKSKERRISLELAYYTVCSEQRLWFAVFSRKTIV
jgi:hypothetical protein